MVAVSDDQGVPVLVALTSGSLELVLYFSLKCLGEHLFGPLASDLVEVERELLLTGGLIVCTLCIGVSFPPTLARRLFHSITRREDTPRLSGNLRSTTFEHISRGAYRRHGNGRLIYQRHIANSFGIHRCLVSYDSL